MRDVYTKILRGEPALVDARDIPILVASIPLEDLPLYLNAEIYSYEGYYGSTGSGAKPGPTIGLVSKRKDENENII